MGLRLGYKLTEVGVIPITWDVAKLVNLVKVGPKNGYSGRCSKDASGTPTLSLGATTSGVMVLNRETIKNLEETIDQSSDLFLQDDDVLIQRSNTLDLVGTTAVFSGPSGTFVYPDLMIRVRFHSSATAQWFWRYANSANGRRFFTSVAAGSSGSMPKISGERLRGMLLPVPPLSEQRAIASALSDVDALLDGLTRLIAKKRDMKQAVMQQLLTGQTRLPGFQGEWEAVAVQDVIVDSFCGPSPTCQERNTQGAAEWGVLKTTAATKDGGWDWTKHKTLPRVFWNQPKIELRSGDVIVTKAGPRHRVGVPACVSFVPPQIIPSGKMIALRPRVCRVEPLMLAAAIASRETQTYLDHRTTGMAESQVNFENSALLNAPVRLPHIDEQVAIVSIIADMESELKAMEARRAKTCVLKEAMVQELLTGKTRLV